MTLTKGCLLDFLNYDPISGHFTWTKANGSRAKAGARAGTQNARGYRYVMIDGKLYLEHRLAWLVTHGYWPLHQVDHIDGDKSNNAASNLREATNAENSRNRGPTVRSTSGLKGVGFHKAAKKWRAQIVIDGTNIHLGLFDSSKEAHAAYDAAARHWHGQFARVFA